MIIYTIGHSNHSVDKFTQLLNNNGIMVLVDVRTAPYSRYSPQYNKENLEHELQQFNIQYVFAGRYLGGRPTDASLYKSRSLPPKGADYLHEVDYQEIMKRHWFMNAIQQLLQLADQDLIAIMCSEEDPAQCHRHHLITKYLLDEYPEIEVNHIRGDGTVYHANTIQKSVNKPKAEQGRLF